MFLTLHLPPLHSLKLSNPFLHGSTPITILSKPASSFNSPKPRSFSFLPPIQAMKLMQGKVVCSTNDKTVSVEVVRLAPHPKYKKRIKIKKKYQAHDPDNRFKVGDIVQLERSRPISKTKSFIAIPVPPRNSTKKETEEASGELGIRLESQQALA